MKFFEQWGRFMMMGARAHARWEINVSNTILSSKKRLLILGAAHASNRAGWFRICRSIG